MGSYSRLVVFGLVTLTTACSSLERSDAGLQTRQRWNHMRGRVKHGLAKQEYEAGLFDDAANTITESIALEPDQAGAYALLARANLELGKPASAQEALDAATRLELSSGDLTYMQGVILEQRGQLEPAAARYTQARTLDPRNVDYLVAEAESLVALDRPVEALRLLDEHADAIDDGATIRALGAHIAALLGDVEGAWKRYEQALLECRMSNVECRLFSRSIQSTIHNPQSTIPASRLIAEELGRLLARAGRYDEAVAVLRPLLESPHLNGMSNVERVHSIDNLQSAIDNSFEQEVSAGVRRVLGASYLAIGDPASAKRVLVEYARTHPDDALAQLLLAKAAIATDDILTALGAVDRTQQREPDRPELWLVRATVNWKRGRLGAAASDLYDVLQNNPNDIEAHCLLAEVLRAQQRLEGARTHFQDALRINADCAWASAGLKALKKTKRLSPARPPSKLTLKR